MPVKSADPAGRERQAESLLVSAAGHTSGNPARNSAGPDIAQRHALVARAWIGICYLATLFFDRSRVGHELLRGRSCAARSRGSRRDNDLRFGGAELPARAGNHGIAKR